MSELPNWFSSYGSNSASQNSSFPSQNSDKSIHLMGFQPYGYHPPSSGFPSQGFMFSDSSRRTSIDGSGTDGGTPSSGKAVQGLEDINFAVHPQCDEDEQIMNKGRVFYSDAESEVLAKCWIDVSIDSRVGNDQKGEQMWNRVAQAFSENRPANTPTRKAHQLKSHFYKMQKQVKLFSECYNRIASIWQSGTSDADIMEMAQTEYKQHHGTQGFRYIGVWRILSTAPKFAEVQGNVQASKRTKNTEGGACTSSSTAEDTPTSRPMGQKAAKRKAKGKEKKEDLSALMEIANKHEDNAVKYIRIMEENARIKKEELRLEEYKIVMMDTSEMTEMQRSLHKLQCEKILKKWEDDN